MHCALLLAQDRADKVREVLEIYPQSSGIQQIFLPKSVHMKTRTVEICKINTNTKIYGYKNKCMIFKIVSDLLVSWTNFSVSYITYLGDFDWIVFGYQFKACRPIRNNFPEFKEPVTIHIFLSIVNSKLYFVFCALLIAYSNILNECRVLC